MEHFEDHTGMMSDEEQKQWKEDEERFFNDADHRYARHKSPVHSVKDI